MGINDELGEAKNFTTQVESVSETRLFPFLGSQSSDDIFNGKNTRIKERAYFTGFKFML